MRCSGLWCPEDPLLKHSSEEDMCARGPTLAPSLPGADVKCDGREDSRVGKKGKNVYVRVDCSSAEHGSVAVVRRSAGGRQDRSGAEGHDRHDPDCSELLDPHIASE
jgi:hypothetical protein